MWEKRDQTNFVVLLKLSRTITSQFTWFKSIICFDICKLLGKVLFFFNPLPHRWLDIILSNEDMFIVWTINLIPSHCYTSTVIVTYLFKLKNNVLTTAYCEKYIVKVFRCNNIENLHQQMSNQNSTKWQKLTFSTIFFSFLKKTQSQLSQFASLFLVELYVFTNFLYPPETVFFVKSEFMSRAEKIIAPALGKKKKLELCDSA